MAVPNIRDMIDTDYQWIDSGIQVSAAVTQQDASTSWSCANAMKFNRMNTWESIGGVDLPPSIIVFKLWKDECTEAPRVGARINAESLNYRVFQVDTMAADTTYECSCIQVT